MSLNVPVAAAGTSPVKAGSGGGVLDASKKHQLLRNGSRILINQADLAEGNVPCYSLLLIFSYR